MCAYNTHNTQTCIYINYLRHLTQALPRSLALIQLSALRFQPTFIPLPPERAHVRPPCGHQYIRTPRRILNPVAASADKAKQGKECGNGRELTLSNRFKLATVTLSQPLRNPRTRLHPVNNRLPTAHNRCSAHPFLPKQKNGRYHKDSPGIAYPTPDREPRHRSSPADSPPSPHPHAPHGATRSSLANIAGHAHVVGHFSPQTKYCPVLPLYAIATCFVGISFAGSSLYSLRVWPKSPRRDCA